MRPPSRFGALHVHFRPKQRIRLSSTGPSPKNPPQRAPQAASPPTSAPPPSAGATRTSALSRLQARLPARLRPYVTPLLSAPLSHVTSFLVLHEMTAVAPLLALFAAFHYSDAVWLERWRDRVEGSDAYREGVGKWGRYLRRKGWIGEEGRAAEGVFLAADGAEGAGLADGKGEAEGTVSSRPQYETVGGKPARVVLELAAAWAITKAMLPARLALSVWATTWFARVAVVPISNVARRLMGR